MDETEMKKFVLPIPKMDKEFYLEEQTVNEFAHNFAPFDDMFIVGYGYYNPRLHGVGYYKNLIIDSSFPVEVYYNKCGGYLYKIHVYKN